MRLQVTKWGIAVTVGAALLLVAAFGAGAWLGTDFIRGFYSCQVLPRANANANLLQRKLVLLDQEDKDALRGDINMELDSEVLALCILTKDRSDNSAAVIASALETLHRVAKYRSERPPTYPAAYTAQVDASVRKRLQVCLDEAAVTPGK